MTNLSPTPIQKFFANNGRPAAGYLLFTYAAGTDNKIATYVDASGGTPNTNPIVLDFRGECRLWIDPQLAYKFILSPRGDTDPPTRPIWTVDDITAAPIDQDNTAVDTGSVNNVELSIPRISAPVAFTRIIFKAVNTNTGATTISINGGTAKNLTWQSAVALSAGSIVANGIYEAIYDGAQWQLQGPTLQPGDVRLYGAVGNGAANDTAAFVAAAATGLDIYVPPGSFLVDGGALTLSAVGQQLVGAGPGNSLIKKRSNGNLVTLSAAMTTIRNIGVHNNDAGTFTGFNIYSSGGYSGLKILDVNSFRSTTNCLRIEGVDGGLNSGHWTIRSGSYDNTPAGLGVPPIYLGVAQTGATYAALYGEISDVQVGPSGNPIRLDAIGGFHVNFSQIGGFDNNAAGGVTTVNSLVGNRITGAVSIEGANHQCLGNAVGVAAITFEAGSSGNNWIGNSRDGASTLTNNGLVSNTILDTASGLPAFLGNFRVNNNLNIRFYDAAGTNFGQMGMSAANNLGLSNLNGAVQIGASGTNRVQLFNNAGTMQTSVCGGGQLLIANLAADPATDVVNGQIYYNTVTDKFRGRAGGVWVDLH